MDLKGGIYRSNCLGGYCLGGYCLGGYSAGVGRRSGGNMVPGPLIITALATVSFYWTGECSQFVEKGLLERREEGRERMMSRHSLLPSSNTEIHITPMRRRPDSVIPPRYYIAPHNVNPHNYRYILNNPNLCIERREVFLLMMVRTVAAHVDRRMAIRDTWAANFNLPGVSLPLVFLLGATRDESEQKEINLEDKIYHDVIQEDFADTHLNLSLKTSMAFKWARTYCPHADYVMISNDNLVVDTFKLVPYLQSLQYRGVNQFVLCQLVPCCSQADSVRDVQQQSAFNSDSLYYTGYAFPAYCSSTLYIAPSTVIHKLHLMSKDTPRFAPDGPWLGVLAEKLGLYFSETSKSFVGGISAGLRDDRMDIVHTFNASTYLSTPIMVGVIEGIHRQREGEMIRKLWSLILANHRDRPPLEVQRYMGQSKNDSDSHIYQVALAALLIDLAVMIIIGYIVFCRRRGKSLPVHSASHYSYQR